MDEKTKAVLGWSIAAIAAWGAVIIGDGGWTYCANALGLWFGLIVVAVAFEKLILDKW